tara:strand:+ start:75 stop:401 length:327 start_codon:yes stop_codon:yes gene_type:complete
MSWKSINLQGHYWIRDDSSSKFIVAKEIRDEETARLISASPDLLIAAINLIHSLENEHGVYSFNGSTYGEVPVEAIKLLHKAAKKAAKDFDAQLPHHKDVAVRDFWNV